MGSGDCCLSCVLHSGFVIRGLENKKPIHDTAIIPTTTGNCRCFDGKSLSLFTLRGFPSVEDVAITHERIITEKKRGLA